MAADFDILSSVKNAMGITGNAQDNTLNVYINEVKEFLMDAGCNKALVDSESAAGLIARGVVDLWQYDSGEARFSSYFMMRTIQLKAKSLKDNKNV